MSYRRSVTSPRASRDHSAPLVEAIRPTAPPPLEPTSRGAQPCATVLATLRQVRGV